MRIKTWDSSFITTSFRDHAFLPMYATIVITNQIIRNQYMLPFSLHIPNYFTSTKEIDVKQTPIMLRPYMSIEFDNIKVEAPIIHWIT